MAAARTIWGIDLGHCALKAIRLRQAGDRVEALSHAYIEHPKVIAPGDTDARTVMDAALRAFLARPDARADAHVIAVPGPQTLARFTRLPPVPDARKLPDLIRFEANQQIPFDMDEVVWDYHVFRPEAADALEVGIFAIRRDLLAEHLRPFTDAGLTPIAVQSGPLALYNAFRYDQPADVPVLLMDIGARTTDLIVAEPNSLWTRNVPLGGNHITDALARTFKLGFAKAEQLKRTAASSQYARQIFQAMRPVFADLVAEVQRSLGFYASTHRGQRIARAIALGNAFRLPGLQKFLQSNLSLPIDRPTTFSKLALATVPDAPQLLEHLPSYAVAYGLALQGLGLAPIQASLLPPALTKALAWRRKTPWFIAAAATLALSALAPWARHLRDAAALRSAAGTYTSVPSIDLRSASAIEQSPPAGKPPAEHAAAILAAHTAYGNAARQHQEDLAALVQEAETVRSLRADALLWPRVTQAIMSALPAPQEPLRSALDKGPEEYKRACAAVPRNERLQVFVNSISTMYCANVVEAYGRATAAESGGTAAMRPPGIPGTPETPPGAPEEATGDGYIIKIVGQTPSREGSAFLERAFLKALNGKKVEPGPGSAPGFSFYVDMQRGYRCWQIESRSLHMGPGGGSGYGGGVPGGGGFGTSGGFGASGTGVGAPKTIDTTLHGVDAVTGEPLGKDYEFVVYLRVLLKKPVAEAASGGHA